MSYEGKQPLNLMDSNLTCNLPFTSEKRRLETWLKQEFRVSRAPSFGGLLSCHNLKVCAVSLLSLAPRCSGKVGHWVSISWIIAANPYCSLPLNYLPIASRS